MNKKTALEDFEEFRYNKRTVTITPWPYPPEGTPMVITTIAEVHIDYIVDSKGERFMINTFTWKPVDGGR